MLSSLPLNRSLCAFFCLIMLQTSPLFAQVSSSSELANTEDDEPAVFEYELGFEAGVSSIENADGGKDQFFATAFLPEFSYGKWSGGLLMKLHLHTKDFNTRSEDYDSFKDVLNIIRFVQYSEKETAGTYVRFGDLEESTLGFGQFINQYRNSISLDDQKRGIELMYTADKYAVEALFSNFYAPEVYGLRGVYFPNSNNPFSHFRSLAFGASVAGDFSDQGTLINPLIPGAPYLVEPFDMVETAVGVNDDRIAMIGLDVSMPVFLSDETSALVYGELSKIINHGSGVGVGIRGRWNFPDKQMRFEGQFEQRIMGKSYLPSYFNSLYEVARLEKVSIPVETLEEDLPASNSQRNVLTGLDKVRYGSYISIGWRWNRMVRLRTSFQNSWNLKNSGWFHIDARVKSADLPFFLRLTFDVLQRQTIMDVTDTGDKLSSVRLEFAYRIYKPLLVGFGFRNSFEPEFRNGTPIGLTKRQRIEPKFVLTF